jgi:Ca2+-binding RTX toxin-like protein
VWWLAAQGVRSQGPQEEAQGHTEATASEETRCSQTRTFKVKGGNPPDHTKTLALKTTNDVPGCPKGGLLSGADSDDWLVGKKGADEIHGLGGNDLIVGGSGSDIIYGGPGVDSLDGDCKDQVGCKGDDVIYGGDGTDNLWGSAGEDVLYGGDGNDLVVATSHLSEDGQRDKLYCGPGKDEYDAGKLDYVDSSCEEKVKGWGGLA